MPSARVKETSTERVKTEGGGQRNLPKQKPLKFLCAYGRAHVLQIERLMCTNYKMHKKALQYTLMFKKTHKIVVVVLCFSLHYFFHFLLKDSTVDFIFSEI